MASEREQFQVALDQFHEGQFKESQLAIEIILGNNPDHADSLHLAGLLSYRQGEYKAAAVSLRRAVELSPASQMYCNFAMVLQAMGRPAEAAEQCHQALALDSSYTNSWLQLGISQQALGDNQAAVGSYRILLESQPDDVDAHNNLGAALQSLGELDAALHSFDTALRLRPDYPRGHFNRGRVLQDMREPVQAEACYRSALRLKPGFADAHHNLAGTLAAQGRTAEAIESYQRGIAALLQNPPPPAAAKPPISQDLARQVLFEARALLSGAAIEFVPCTGTLLGIVRDGDVLPHDRDLDIGVSWDVDRSRLLHTLTDTGQFTYPLASLRIEADREWSLRVVHGTSRIELDVSFFKPDGDYFLAGFNFQPHPILSRPHRFALSTLHWFGEDWLVPDNCELYLEDYYGPGWRQPDPDFETVISSYCQTPASADGRRCYGYTRLHERIRNRHWRKAQAFCRQLLRVHSEDPFLTALLAELDRQLG